MCCVEVRLIGQALTVDLSEFSVPGTFSTSQSEGRRWGRSVAEKADNCARPARYAGFRSSSSLHPLRREKESQIFWPAKSPGPGNPHIFYVAGSRAPTLESASWAHTSLKLGMTACTDAN